MDVWIIINPILKVLLYAASFVSVELSYLVFTLPNTSHWRRRLIAIILPLKLLQSVQQYPC